MNTTTLWTVRRLAVLIALLAALAAGLAHTTPHPKLADDDPPAPASTWAT